MSARVDPAFGTETSGVATGRTGHPMAEWALWLVGLAGCLDLHDVEVFAIRGYDTDTALMVVAIPTGTDDLYALFVPPEVSGVPPDLCKAFPCVSP